MRRKGSAPASRDAARTVAAGHYTDDHPGALRQTMRPWDYAAPADGNDAAALCRGDGFGRYGAKFSAGDRNDEGRAA
jgi:hypothetical protein